MHFIQIHFICSLDVYQNRMSSNLVTYFYHLLLFRLIHPPVEFPHKQTQSCLHLVPPNKTHCAYPQGLTKVSDKKKIILKLGFLWDFWQTRLNGAIEENWYSLQRYIVMNAAHKTHLTDHHTQSFVKRCGYSAKVISEPLSYLKNGFSVGVCTAWKSLFLTLHHGKRSGL